MTIADRTPGAVWSTMAQGNDRFVAGAPRHPHQDAERRTEVSAHQRPDAALFGCSDSRIAAEIIFDMGLGDLFVVRNAGQIVSDSVIGSLEYAVAMLDVPLIVVLAHDECGAVRAAIDQDGPDAQALPASFQSLVAQITPAVHRVRRITGASSTDTIEPFDVGREHLRATVGALLSRSELISEAVADGRLAIVGANYQLHDGRVNSDAVVGVV